MTELSVKTIHFAHSYGFCERKYNSILTKKMLSLYHGIIKKLQKTSLYEEYQENITSDRSYRVY